MKSLIFVLPNLQGGGAERVVLNVIRGLDKGKFKPILFLIKNEGVYWSEVPPNINVVTVLNSGQNVILNIVTVIWKLLVVARKADIIIGSLELTATYLAVIVGVILRKPSVGWVHTDMRLNQPNANKKIHSKLVQWLYPYLSLIICVSTGVADGICELLPCITGRTKVIYNPLYTEEIIRQSNEPLDYNFPNNVILAVGRLRWEKGFDLLIRAHEKLIKADVKHTLIILGEGKERVAIEKLIYELHMEDTIILPGFQQNPYKWLKAANAFVLSSRCEGLSMVLLEAMILGTPVISFNCPSGPAEILENGRYGLLVPRDDIDALAAAMKNILKQRDVASKLSRLGKERAQQFSTNNIISKFEEAFINVKRVKIIEMGESIRCQT